MSAYIAIVSITGRPDKKLTVNAASFDAADTAIRSHMQTICPSDQWTYVVEPLRLRATGRQAPKTHDHAGMCDGQCGGGEAL